MTDYGITWTEAVADMVQVMKATKVGQSSLYAAHWYSPAVLESIALQLIDHYSLMPMLAKRYREGK